MNSMGGGGGEGGVNPARSRCKGTHIETHTHTHRHIIGRIRLRKMLSLGAQRSMAHTVVHPDPGFYFMNVCMRAEVRVHTYL